MLTPRGWVKVCELEKAAIEHLEKWIELERKLDPNWTEEKSFQRRMRMSGNAAVAWKAKASNFA